MSQTLFLKDNKPYVRLTQGEFEVSAECYTKGTSRDGESYWYNLYTGTTTVGISEKEKFEWPGKVELICDCTLNNVASTWCRCSGKVARLLPEEKKDTGAHSYTESAYKEGEYYGDCCPLCGQIVHPVKIGYLTRWYCENGDCLNCNPVKIHAKSEPVSAPSESQEYKIILEKFRQFIADQKDIDPEIAKVIQAKIWEII